MSTPLRTLFRTVWTSALLGFVVGAAVAAWELSTSTWVREFQAGEESPWSERLVALAQRSTIEGLGFGALALVIGLTAYFATRNRSDEDAPRRTFGNVLVGAAALSLWTWATWITDAALPFLRTSELWLMNVVGLVLCAIGIGLWVALAALLPWSSKRDAAAHTLASLLFLWAAIWWALECVMGVKGGHESPEQLGKAAGGALAALLLGALGGRLLEGPLHALEAMLGRISNPLRVGSLVFGLALFGCIVLSWSTLEPSAVDTELEYARLEAPGDPPGPNVILVTIDTLRADHLGCYGYERPTSPFIDSLAAAGTVFADASAPASWTKPSTGTILTGLYPSRHGALYHGSALQLPEGERTLAEAFHAEGYATAGFVSNPNVKRVFDFDRGFQEYFDSPVEDTVTLAAIRNSLFGAIVMKLSRHQFNWKYENDIRSMNRHVFAWLETNAEVPFFLYVHYIDPHIPYTPPAEYEEQFAQDHEGFPLFNERKRLVAIDRYDGEIRYTDDGIQALYAKLEKLGIADETMLVFTSDHGEEFFEHELLGHGFSLYQPVVHVPLIAWGPGVAAGRVVDSPVRIVDMPATLLDLAGTGITELGDGRSFADAIREPDWTPPEVVYFENEFGQDVTDQRSFVLNGVRDGPYKFIVTERNLYRPPTSPKYDAQELYDLSADPDEQNNLIDAPEHQDRIAELVARLREHSVFLNETGFRDHEPAALSPEVEEEMRALGYLGDE